MQLHTTKRITQKRTRRLGRGHGTGRGKTAGRGTKGQKARGTIKWGFEGGQLALIKRLPLFRGRMKNRPVSQKAFPINLKVLNILPKDTVVTYESLVKHHILSADVTKADRVKILGDGELTIALTIAIPISKSAAKKVEAAGGKITFQKTQKTEKSS